MNADYNQFCSLGREDIHFNNVVSENLFGIPISQVKIVANTYLTILECYNYTSQAALPGLHVSLCIFMKLWWLLENNCHKLDLELAMVGERREGDRQGFAVFSERLHEIQKLEEEESVAQYAQTLDELTTAVAMRVGQTSQMLQDLLQAIKAQHMYLMVVLRIHLQTFVDMIPCECVAIICFMVQFQCAKCLIKCLTEWAIICVKTLSTLVFNELFFLPLVVMHVTKSYVYKTRSVHLQY